MLLWGWSQKKFKKGCDGGRIKITRSLVTLYLTPSTEVPWTIGDFVCVIGACGSKASPTPFCLFADSLSMLYVLLGFQIILSVLSLS